MHEPFNGSTHAILYKLGRLEVMAENTQHTARETQGEVRELSSRLDMLERRTVRDLMLDASGWIAGAVILFLAIAGKWAELSAFLGAVGK